MEENLIFCFTGTGNSLHLAMHLAEELEPCQFVSMENKNRALMKKRYHRIGFIYPVYYGGMPRQVVKFINSLDFSNNRNTYFFGVATYGGMLFNGVRQLRYILREKNIRLHYGNHLKSPDNYILMFDMDIDYPKFEAIYNQRFPIIKNDILSRKVNNIKKQIPLVTTYYNQQMKKISNVTKDYTVNDNCIDCTICKIVCPVNNIKTKNNKPSFGKKCEQCMACIQYCPVQAINYKDKTEHKGRYNHPEITYKFLKKFYKKNLI